MLDRRPDTETNWADHFHFYIRIFLHEEDMMVSWQNDEKYTGEARAYQNDRDEQLQFTFSVTVDKGPIILNSHSHICSV